MNKALMVSVMFGVLILALQKFCHLIKSERFVKKEYAINMFSGFRSGYNVKIAKEWQCKHERKILMGHFDDCCNEAERFIKSRFLYFIFPRHFNKIWGFGWFHVYSDKNAHKWRNTASIYYSDMLREFKKQLQH
jgi:hypothetical protein